MPRRPKKLPPHLFKPGQSGNPAGRTVGSKNEINQEIRQAFSLLLYNQLPNLEAWLAEGAKKDPLKTADILLRVSERFLPSLSRTELVGKDGEAFTPITIHLPNIPKVDLSVGAASESSLNLPGTSGIALPSSPVEDLKGSPDPMGQGDTHTTDLPLPMFKVPPLELSPNQLRDLKEMGEVPPGGETGPQEGLL